MDQTPLTLRDASTGLFLVDENDVPNAQVWLGLNAERLTLEGTYKERVLQYPGVPYGQAHQEDEDHTIELQLVWLHDVSTGAARMPTLVRGVRYQFVCVWSDPEAGVWTRRVYTGVTAQPNRIEDFTQTIKLRAEQMFEFAGTGTAPLVVAALPGVVTYVNGFARLNLYHYDFITDSYAPIDAGMLVGRALIDLTVSGQCTITFGGTDSIPGVPALHATAALCQVKHLAATGGTFLDVSPRLEWYRGTTRAASLSATGVLAVANAHEQPAQPAVSDDFVAASGSWLFSISGARAYAPDFAETL